MTTTTRIQTIDKRPRTSDGTTVCDRCGEIVPEGDRYQQETVTTSGGNIEIDVCMHCLTAKDGNDWLAAFTVGATITILLSVAAAVFGG
jgi:NMD protein affecting ribosome stability and mRNA decay